MPGMKRFVTYIYSYEDNRKGSNVGFAKIELRGDVFRLEIHLRRLLLSRSLCRIYLIRVENSTMIGFPVGKMEFANGTGDCSLGMSALKIAGSDYSIRDMDGLMLSDEENRFFVSRWKEGEALIVNFSHFKEWSISDVQDAPAPTPTSGASATDTPAAQDSTPDTLSATELPMRNFFPRYRLTDVWETLSSAQTVSTPFPEKGIECLKIELKDLRELPRRFWYLGNNSFLLHGFFNYRYLVLAKCPNERYFLGIPGIYQNQERVMATIFGFPEFVPEWIPDAPETAEPINRFGCWYRFLDEA